MTSLLFCSLACYHATTSERSRSQESGELCRDDDFRTYERLRRNSFSAHGGNACWSPTQQTSAFRPTADQQRCTRPSQSALRLLCHQAPSYAIDPLRRPADAQCQQRLLTPPSIESGLEDRSGSVGLPNAARPIISSHGRRRCRGRRAPGRWLHL